MNINLDYLIENNSSDDIDMNNEIINREAISNLLRPFLLNQNMNEMHIENLLSYILMRYDNLEINQIQELITNMSNVNLNYNDLNSIIQYIQQFLD